MQVRRSGGPFTYCYTDGTELDVCLEQDAQVIWSGKLQKSHSNKVEFNLKSGSLTLEGAFQFQIGNNEDRVTVLCIWRGGPNGSYNNVLGILPRS